MCRNFNQVKQGDVVITGTIRAKKSRKRTLEGTNAFEDIAKLEKPATAPNATANRNPVSDYLVNRWKTKCLERDFQNLEL